MSAAAPPGLEPITQEAAPEHIGRAGNLPRHQRDQVAHQFMAEFGMSGAEAVRRAKDFVANPVRFIENERRSVATQRLDLTTLARMMRELPLGLTHGIDALSRSIRSPRGVEAR